jgi:branched-chain amino acid transport system substrate-binding protein
MRFIGFACTVGACLLSVTAHGAIPPKEVMVGLASNFTEVSTSSSNPFGGYFRDGVSLALMDGEKKLKANGIRIVTKEFDYGTSDARVLEAAKSAVDSDVVAVVGYNWSSQALLAAPIHQAGKLPMLTPSATANRIGSLGQYVHQACFDNAFMGETLATVAKKRLKAKRAVVIAAADCAYCTDLSSAFTKQFENGGGKVVASLSVLQNDKNFDSVIDQLKSVEFDTVLIPNQELLSARIIAALNAKGIHKPFLGGDGWGNVGEEFFGILGKQEISGYSTSHWHPEESSTLSKRFTQKYKAKFGKLPNDTSVLAYDSMSLLIDLIIRTPNRSRAGIEEAFRNLKSYSGVTGKFIFSRERAPLKSLVLLSVNNSKFQVLDRIEPAQEAKK